MHLCHCVLIPDILQKRPEHQSWEIEIDGHCDDNRRRGSEIGFESRNGGCDEGYVSDV